MDGNIFEITAKEVIALVLVLGAMIGLVIALLGRNKSGTGIGWQFIRFTSIMISLPIAAALSLTDTLNTASATILAGALGYSFGHSGEPRKEKQANE